MARYLDSAGRYDHDDEVAMYLLAYHQQTNQSQQTNEQTKVIQELVSPEVSKLNNPVKNKKQRDQKQFSLEKRLARKKRMKSSNPSHQSMDCVIRWGI